MVAAVQDESRVVGGLHFACNDYRFEEIRVEMLGGDEGRGDLRLVVHAHDWQLELCGNG